MIYYHASDGQTKVLGDLPNDTLQHWKYIKKIPVGKGFRYFYSWDEYRAYLADPAAELQKAGQQAQQQIETAGRRGQQELQNVSRSAQQYIAKGQKTVEKKLSKMRTSDIKVGAVRQANANVSPEKRSRLEKIRDSVKSKWESGKRDITEKVEKAKQWIDKKFEKKPRDRNEQDEKVKEQYKYVEKKKINGKYRYFYSQEELDAYNKRKEYQKNEPDYLKKLKHSEDPYTKEEDSILVNPNFGKKSNTDWYNNCAECSAIYELRRRGYDVESNGVSGQPNSSFFPMQLKEYIDMYKYNTEGRFERFYENPNTQQVERTKDFGNEELNDKYTAEAIKKEILKNPPGSRGDISVQWKDGGGHSMVWEIDNDGKIHIIDTQASGYGNRVEYDIDYIAKKTDNSSRRLTDPSKGYTTITRTDNLELKKDITKICKNSSDRKKQEPTQHKLTLHDGEFSNTEPMSDEERTTKYPVLSEKEHKK